MKMLFREAFIILVFGVICNGESLKGYIVNEADGHAYKIMTKAEKWTVAKETCEKNGDKLAVPKSDEEFAFMQQNVSRRLQYNDVTGMKSKEFVFVMFIGINNFDDYKVFKNVDGENINDTGFHRWSYSQEQLEIYLSSINTPRCGAMDSFNKGIRDWNCDTPQPYICQKLDSDSIGRNIISNS